MMVIRLSLPASGAPAETARPWDQIRSPFMGHVHGLHPIRLLKA